jgi:hypothetical protein
MHQLVEQAVVEVEVEDSIPHILLGITVEQVAVVEVLQVVQVRSLLPPFLSLIADQAQCSNSRVESAVMVEMVAPVEEITRHQTAEPEVGVAEAVEVTADRVYLCTPKSRVLAPLIFLAEPEVQAVTAVQDHQAEHIHMQQEQTAQQVRLEHRVFCTKLIYKHKMYDTRTI